MTGDYEASSGKLAYSPASHLSSDMMMNELATLLTSGRINKARRETIRNVCDEEPNETEALIMAMQLIVTSAEFHASGAMAQKSCMGRPGTPEPRAFQRATQSGSVLDVSR